MTVSPMPVNWESVRPFALQSDQMNQRYLQFPCRLFMRVHLGMLEMNLDLEMDTEEDDSDGGCRSLPRKHSRSRGAE
uniref:GG21401 n=1 Tax=Drosophila erecta TaxID=7220 RepID=B3P0N6_DROER